MTTTPQPLARPLTLTQASIRLGVGLSTLRTWMREGKIEYFRPGRNYRIPAQEIDRIKAMK